jgi:hypothetical protein
LQRNVAVIYETKVEDIFIITAIYSSNLERVVFKKEAIRKMALIIKYDSEADVLVVKVKEGALANEELLDKILLSYLW